MLHTKFRENRPPVLEKKIFEGFLPYMGAGIKRTDNSRFYTYLEFVRPIYFAKNVKKSVRKFTFFR